MDKSYKMMIKILNCCSELSLSWLPGAKFCLSAASLPDFLVEDLGLLETPHSSLEPTYYKHK